MSHGNDIDRIETHGHIQRLTNAIRSLLDENLECRSLGRIRLGSALGKSPVNQPSCAGEHKDQSRLQSKDHQATKCAGGLHLNERTKVTSELTSFSLSLSENAGMLPRTFRPFMIELKMRSSLTSVCHSASVRSRA